MEEKEHRLHLNIRLLQWPRHTQITSLHTMIGRSELREEGVEIQAHADNSQSQLELIRQFQSQIPVSLNILEPTLLLSIFLRSSSRWWSSQAQSEGMNYSTRIPVSLWWKYRIISTEFLKIDPNSNKQPYRFFFNLLRSQESSIDLLLTTKTNAIAFSCHYLLP